MQDRLNQNDVSNRVNVETPLAVCDAVVELFTARYPGADFAAVGRAFADFQALFEGRYPGYLGCDTLYHDIRHTLDMTLAMARLVDGHDRTCSPTERLGARRAMLGVLIALLHDSGYLKRSSEAGVGNGAVFTKVHVSRSADFISAYLPKIGFAREAPLASRRLLYEEFVWAKIARERLPDGREIVRYSSPEDLILKTPSFYEHVARTRIDRKLARADRYAESHFDGPNLYQSEIDRNMGFLREAIDTADLNRLRRDCYSLSARPGAAPA